MYSGKSTEQNTFSKLEKVNHYRWVGGIRQKRKDTYSKLRNHGVVSYEAREVSRDLVFYAENLKKSLWKDFKIIMMIIPVGIDKAPRWGQ